MDRSSTEDNNIDMMMAKYYPNPYIKLLPYADAIFDNSSKIKIILNFNQLFTTDKLLGAGEFGVTYLIRDHNNNPYALKISIFEGGDDEDMEREIESLIHFSKPHCHPQLLCYKDHFILNDRICILTDYIDGKPLNKSKNLTLQQIESIYLELLNTLAWMHSKGYNHGDVNPGNIMITPQGQVKLIDFGFVEKMNPQYEKDVIGEDLYQLSKSISGALYNKSPRLCFKKLLKLMSKDEYVMSAKQAYDLMLECLASDLEEMFNDFSINNVKTVKTKPSIPKSSTTKPSIPKPKSSTIKPTTTKITPKSSTSKTTPKSSTTKNTTKPTTTTTKNTTKPTTTTTKNTTKPTTTTTTTKTTPKSPKRRVSPPSKISPKRTKTPKSSIK